MARVTVEDCLEKVENRFALTVLGSRRARQLSEGRGTPLVQCSNKAGVTALREIGNGGVRFAEDVENTMREFIEEQRRDLQTLSFTDDVDFGPGSFGDPDGDGVDYDDDIEELVPDLTRVKPENRNDAEDDDNPKNTMDAVNNRSEDSEDGESEDSDDDGESDDSGEDFEGGEEIDLPELSDDEDGDGGGDAEVDFDDDDDDKDGETGGEDEKKS